MSIFKCKMCGGTIEFQPGDTIGVCDSCGTKQTLPRLDSDRKANLFDRANHFRRNNEFDKAMGIYETMKKHWRLHFLLIPFLFLSCWQITKLVLLSLFKDLLKSHTEPMRYSIRMLYRLSDTSRWELMHWVLIFCLPQLTSSTVQKASVFCMPSLIQVYIRLDPIVY